MLRPFVASQSLFKIAQATPSPKGQRVDEAVLPTRVDGVPPGGSAFGLDQRPVIAALHRLNKTVAVHVATPNSPPPVPVGRSDA